MRKNQKEDRRRGIKRGAWLRKEELEGSPV
jgi:hypothetical protein